MVGSPIIKVYVFKLCDTGLKIHFQSKTGENGKISKQAHPAEIMGWGSQTVRWVQRQKLSGKGTLR